MSELKIRRSTLEIVMLCLSFYEFTCVPHSLFLIIKYSIIAYLLLSHIKECGKIKQVVAPILLYGGITFIATLVHQNVLNRQGSAFVYMLHIFGNLCYHCCIYAMSRGGNTCKIAYKDIVGVCTCDRYSYGVY